MPTPRQKVSKASMGPKVGKGPKGMSKTLDSGTVMFDLVKKPWTIGKVIGQGGFGYLYLVKPAFRKLVKMKPAFRKLVKRSAGSNSPPTAQSEYVIKVEPHSNGPLFSELAFYQRVAKPELISAWMNKHKKAHLGIPKYVASGYFEQGQVKYRFMVMDRFGKDVEKIFQENNRKFEPETAFTYALQIVDVLEYIHDQEYVHADIKSSNLMMGASKSTEKQVYLLDYGLAYRYCPNGTHVPYKEDPKRKHDGTLLYTSIDAHKGCAPSRRGDLEILGYCLAEWLGGKLPWGDILSDKIEDKVKVMNQKIECMGDISGFMRKCFKSGPINEELKRYLELVKKLAYDEKPNYSAVRGIFADGLRKAGVSLDGKPKSSAKLAQKRSSASSFENQSSKKLAVEEKQADPTVVTPLSRTSSKRAACTANTAAVPTEPANCALPSARSVAAKKVENAKRTLARRSFASGTHIALVPTVKSNEVLGATARVVHSRQRRKNVPTRDFGQSP